MNLASELRAWADRKSWPGSAVLRDAAKALDDLTAENERLRETTCADHSLRIHRLVEANSDLIRDHNALLRDGGRWQTRAEVAEAQVRAVLALCDNHAQRHPDPSGQPCDYHCPQQIIYEVRAAIDEAGNGNG